MIGPTLDEIIAEAAVLLGFGASVEGLARTCRAQSTLNEVAKEAAFAVGKRPIHM